MSKIIIGIHGLGNQPAKELLKQWWISSIDEGLEKIGIKGKKYNFELVYWADALHTKPLDINITNEEDELYLQERYHPAKDNHEKTEKPLKEKALNYIKKQLDNFLFNEKLHLNFPSFTDILVKHFFKDMKIYFTQICSEENKADCLAKDVIREKLKDVLLKYKNDKIMIIAHSMGSIITYDVLLRNKEIKTDYLISEGSPIAVPYIFGQMKYSLEDILPNIEKLPTPDNITKAWYNLYDTEDKLAQYSILPELFEPNKLNISPISEAVKNDYENEGVENPHKIYGYLRSKRNAQLINEFLTKDKNKIILWFQDKIGKYFKK